MPLKELVENLTPQQAQALATLLDKLFYPTTPFMKLLRFLFMLLVDRRYHDRMRRLLAALGRNHGVLPSTLTLDSTNMPTKILQTNLGGSYGDVIQTTFGGVDVAVKIPRRARIKPEQYRQSCEEAMLMRVAQHPLILPIIGTYITDEPKGQLAIVTPWCHNGTVDRYLANPAHGNQVLRVLIEVVTVLCYLHSRNIVHNDIHPSNILITADGRVQVADLGISDFVNPTVPNVSAVAGHWDYRSPQKCLADVNRPYHSQPSDDIFAFGILAYQLYTGQSPLGSLSSGWERKLAFRRMVDGERPPRPSADECIRGPLPDALWDLVGRCWQEDPLERPTAEQALHILSGIANA